MEEERQHPEVQKKMATMIAGTSRKRKRPDDGDRVLDKKQLRIAKRKELLAK